MMSRKHFKALAEILKEHKATDKLISDVSVWLRSQNPRFDSSRFYQAAKAEKDGCENETGREQDLRVAGGG
jgi:hypothetical protein